MQINSLKAGMGLEELAGSKKDYIQNPAQQNSSFMDMLSNSINKVNDLQHGANNAHTDFALGKNEDIHDVMIATQKANLSIDMAATVTNKAVSAYEEIMRMQV